MALSTRLLARLPALLASLLVAAALVSCGSGDDAESATPPQAVESLRARALAVSAQAVAPDEAARQLMDFGEAQFPQFFPGPQPTQRLSPFAYRHYPQTGTYLGVVVNAGHGYEALGVYVMGGPFGDAPQYVGPLAQLITPVPPAARPTISRQPADVVVNPGQAAEFLVEATGQGPSLSYQWFRDGQALPGATEHRLVIGAVATADGGSYRARVSQGAGETFSNEAVLTVRAVAEAVPTLLAAQLCLTCHFRDHRPAVGPGMAALADRYRGRGDQAEFLVQRIRREGAGQGPLVAGHAHVRLTDAEAGTIAQWLIAGGPAASPVPRPTVRPTEVIVEVGADTVLTARLAEPAGDVSYQWRHDGLDLPGERQATLTIRGAQAATHAGTYTVVVRNAAGSASASTTLRVVDPAHYPSLPIRIVVPAAAGGPVDRTARALAQALDNRLRGLQVNVVNVGGSDGLDALDQVLASPANGYTLLLAGTALAVAPALHPQRGFDPLRDLAPLGQLGHTPHLLAGGLQLPAGGPAELLAWWRGRTMAPTFAHTGIGQLPHLCALMLAEWVGLPLVPKAYPATAPLMVDLNNRGIDLACLPAPSLETAVQRRQVRPYAVTALERSIVPALSDIGTLDGSGLPGFELTDWHGLYARSGTSPLVLQRVQDALAAVRADETFQRQLTQAGVHPATGVLTTPDGHRAQLGSELERWRALVDRHGLRGN